jgi:hypothetical protein
MIFHIDVATLKYVDDSASVLRTVVHRLVEYARKEIQSIL